jgi:two-component system cell cycle response regulator
MLIKDVKSEELVMNCNVEVLIVEDSPTQAEQLKYILEQHQYVVSVAYNGKDALDLLSKQQPPEIIISDIMMPEMNGYQLCRRIKAEAQYKDIPVILLTSLVDPIDVIRGLECGADNFITKPYNEQFLLSRIRHILINKELRKGGGAEMGIEVFFAGQKHFLTSERIQIIDLLLSTFENAVQKKHELEQSYKELKRALETIKIMEANYRTLLERNADAMIVVGRNGRVLYANPAAEDLFGCNAEEFVGQSFDYEVAAGRVQEIPIMYGEGETLVAEMRVVEINWKGENAFLASLRDVTENVRLREKLRSLSFTDELTGLYNRRGFLTLAQQQLKVNRRTKRGMHLLYIDLDNFKGINDTLGHCEGDLALIAVTNILKETFRESDIIARVGGDEFAVLAIETGKACAKKLVTRLQENVAAYNLKENRYQLSLSIGLARAEHGCFSIEELMALADRLMYEQKRGKGSS